MTTGLSQTERSAAHRKERTCLQLSAGDRTALTDEAPGYAVYLRQGMLRFQTLVTGGISLPKIALKILATLFAHRPQVVISTEYRRGFIANFGLKATLNSAPHVVIGMNLSAKPIVSKNPLVQRMINRVFRRTTAIIVHSTREAELFARMHNLPADKFAFSHWGFDLPSMGSDRFDAADKPYFCMIGRNNRDLETFSRAVQLAGTRGIAIIAGYEVVSPEVAKILEIHRDLPLSDCISCIRNAAANVTLLRDGSRGAGHITVVMGMHLGVPQIFSDTEVLREYFPQGRYGYPVRLGDAEDAAATMRRVLAESGSPDEADRSAEQRLFASTWLSNESVSRRIAHVLTDVLDGRSPSFADPAWAAWESRPSPSPKNSDATTAINSPVEQLS